MMNDKWIRTNKALKQLFKILSCSKCKKSLHDPQQFLNCGHFSCISCINNENTSCVQCQLPCDNGNVIRDDAINQIVQACCTIAKENGFSQDQENVNIEPENVSFLEQLDSTPSVSGNVLTSTNLKSSTNISKQRKRPKKCKGNKNLNNNENSKKAKYNKYPTTLRIPKDIHKVNQYGETKLQQLCKKKQGNIENIKILLDAGANPNVADFAKWTPLQEAVDFNYYDIAKLLLERGANVNQPGHEGRTPLHEAARNNDIEMINLLLKYSANKELVDKDGKRPVDYCQFEEGKILLNCDEDIKIIFEKKRNNENYSENNINITINHDSNNTFKSEVDSHQIVVPVKEQKIELSNIDHEINSQESIDIVNTSSNNEIEQRNIFEASHYSINTESEEIDIIN